MKEFSESKNIEKPDLSNEASEVKRIKELRFPCQDLEGKKHPITDVPYERKIIDLPDGTKIEKVFPVFERSFEGDFPHNLHKEINEKQFEYMNKQLKEAIEADPELRDTFTEKQLEQIRNGDKHGRYTWHHVEDPSGGGGDGVSEN